MRRYDYDYDYELNEAYERGYRAGLREALNEDDEIDYRVGLREAVDIGTQRDRDEKIVKYAVKELNKKQPTGFFINAKRKRENGRWYIEAAGSIIRYRIFLRKWYENGKYSLKIHRTETEKDFDYFNLQHKDADRDERGFKIKFYINDDTMSFDKLCKHFPMAYPYDI